MSVQFTQVRETVPLRAPDCFRRILALFVGLILLAATASSQHSDDASLSGTVRGLNADPVPNTLVRLQSNESSQILTAQTDSQGKYKFSSLRDGVYGLSASKAGFQDATILSVFIQKKEEKTLDLSLGNSKAPANTAAAATSQPQFFDEPQFTVAGVTDATSLGGHGSDTVARTRESLAKDTISLAKTPTVTSNSATTEKSLREQAEREPSGFDANHRLGELLIASGKGAEAVPFLERAAKARPGDYQNSYDLALASFDAGNYASARDRAKTLIGTNDKAELHHLLADTEEKLGDPLDSVREYERAAEMDPKETYLFDWGSELLLHHAPEPALQVFARGNLQFPRSVRMLIGLGAALFARGSYDEAVRKISEASDLDPDDPSPYIFLGRMQGVDAVSSKEIAEKLHRFVTLHPESAPANYYYAIALGKLHKRPPDQQRASEVESLLNKAVDLDPKFSAAYLQLGILHSDSGDYPAAITNFQKALQIDSKLGEAHYRLAQAYRRTGNPEGAKEELKLYAECEKESAQQEDRERHQIQQFVYTLRDQPVPQSK
jgi:tetratricopeptide (TPR) repeat protein